MTKTTMDLSELLQQHDQGDFLRAVAESVLQLLMEADVEGVIGAGKHERADGRTSEPPIPSKAPSRPCATAPERPKGASAAKQASQWPSN